MPKAKAKPRPRVQFTEDLLSVTSKCIRKFCPWPRDRAVRLPLERGGEVVAHCKALIINQGGFKVLIGVPFPQPKGKLYLEIAAEAKPKATGSLYWRLHCPKCGKETTYLYLIDEQVLCQTCGKLKSRVPKFRGAKASKRSPQAKMKELIELVAKRKAEENRLIMEFEAKTHAEVTSSGQSRSSCG